MKCKGWVGGCQEGLPAEVIMMIELTPYELNKLCKGSSEHGGGEKKNQWRTAWCGIKHCSGS